LTLTAPYEPLFRQIVDPAAAEAMVDATFAPGLSVMLHDCADDEAGAAATTAMIATTSSRDGIWSLLIARRLSCRSSRAAFRLHRRRRTRRASVQPVLHRWTEV